jgi:uncharacterized protein
MPVFWSPALWVALLGLSFTPSLPPDYTQKILHDRQKVAQELDAPNGVLSLVALQKLMTGDLTVGSAPDNNLRLEHGLPHAFTLRTQGSKVTFAAVDPSITIDGKHPHKGDPVVVSDDEKATLHWSNGLWANIIARTGNETYLRVGDPNSPNRRHFHAPSFYPVDPSFRLNAKWFPYATPHQLHMSTKVGTILTLPSPGYAEFSLGGAHHPARCHGGRP